MLAARLRRAYPKVLARLLGFTQDLSNAEDAVQEAILRALHTWPTQGMPERPEAWLVTVAKNIVRDRLRRLGRDEHYQDVLALLADRSPWTPDILTPPEDWIRSSLWHDDRLRLLCTACDPVLSFEERTALTLATVCGLSNLEIARAFLVAPRAMEQRITRAKRRLRSRRQEYSIPDQQVITDRLPAVLAVIHLLFNEGHWSSDNQYPIRHQLCQMALDLVGGLVTMIPGAWEARGLLALLMFHEARLPARLDQSGTPVPLPEQDRSQWDHEKIRDADDILQNALSQGQPGEYQLEAAIAAVHVRAKTAEETDWPQIAELYGLLFHHRPTPVVQINQAFAIGQAHGTAQGLAFFDSIHGLDRLENYAYAPLIRGVLLAELGRNDEAKIALERAAALSTQATEIEQIRGRIAKLASNAKEG